jgi:hypothetical protein
MKIRRAGRRSGLAMSARYLCLGNALIGFHCGADIQILKTSARSLDVGAVMVTVTAEQLLREIRVEKPAQKTK